MGEHILFEQDVPILRVQQDTGCSVGGPSCLSCTFSEDMCVYDLPPQKQRAVWASSSRPQPAIAAVVPYLQEGKRLREIAKEAGVSYNTARRARQKYMEEQ